MADKRRGRRHRQPVNGDKWYPRSHGKISPSQRDASIAEVRKKATHGRIQKVLGDDDTFSQSFKDAILNDFGDILERPYLESELMNYKKVIKALRQVPNDPDCKRLSRKIRRDPTKMRGTNILCPVWKNRRIYDVTGAAIPRYLFPEKSSELYLLTVIFGFAENLLELETLIESQRAILMDIIRDLTKKRRGILIAGCFEPDLKTHRELCDPKSGNFKFLKQLGISTSDAGGWILTGHFIIRAPHHEWVRDELSSRFPCSGWKRVQFDEIDKSKTLAQNMLDMLGYAAKYPKPVFRYNTRGDTKKEGDAILNAMKSAFYGPSLPAIDETDAFGVDAAIRQWALFMDRLGEKKIYFTKESTYAQKWYSQSEWNCIRDNNDDLVEIDNQTMHKIELHRDSEFGSDKIKSHLKGRCRKLQTRNLRFDAEWDMETDLGHGPYEGAVYSYDRWMLKKK